MPANLRVLLTADPVLPVPPPLYGGIERIVAQLVGGLRERGVIVGLLAKHDSTCEADWRAEWPSSTSSGLLNTLKNAQAVREAVDSFCPDVVHSFARLASLTAVLRNEQLAKIMSYQRLPTPRTVRLGAWLGGKTIWFTGCSDFIAERGRAAGGCWSAIPNFVDLRTLPFTATVAQDAPAVFLGRIERVKGPHLAIAAARLAKKKLLLAGPHTESGSEGVYWKNEIAPHIDGEQVVYLGPVDDAQKAALLGNACALLSPVQWNEPFGIVFAEALACGTPVIACARGALPEIVREGVDGFLCEGPQALAGALGNVSKLRRENCRRRAEENFALPLAVERYLSLYQEAACRAAS